MAFKSPRVMLMKTAVWSLVSVDPVSGVYVSNSVSPVRLASADILPVLTAPAPDPDPDRAPEPVAEVSMGCTGLTSFSSEPPVR